METAKLPTAAENPNGLHQRYRLTMADGTPVDPRGFYFTLRLDNNGDDVGHVRACRAAAYTYAAAAPNHLAQMATELAQAVDSFNDATVEVPDYTHPGNAITQLAMKAVRAINQLAEDRRWPAVATLTLSSYIATVAIDETVVWCSEDDDTEALDPVKLINEYRKHCRERLEGCGG
jgi:hypothetical protein